MISMTGFARASSRAGGIDMDLEVRSVNHRFLMVRVTADDELARFEPEIDRMVRDAVRRGTVTVRFQLKRASSLPDFARLNERAASYHRLVRQMKRSLKDATPVTLETLIAIPTFWSGLEDPGPDPEAYWRQAEPLLSRALKALAQARAREGELTRREMTKRLSSIEKTVASAERLGPRVIKAYETRLKGRIDTILREHGLNGNSVELAKEIGIFADRCDVAEEVSRLRFHLGQMRGFLASRDPVGRKIEFMAQEMTREANTMAAKSNDGEISSLAVEIKGEIEKIKEQSENLE